MSSQPAITRGAVVKILLGPNRNDLADVLSVADTGHSDFDVLVLRPRSPLCFAPIHLFRLAVELVAPADTGRGYVPEPPASCKPAARACRFKVGQHVIVCHPGLTKHGQRGVIEEVHLDPTDTCCFGGTGNSARYLVRFEWNGFDAPQPATYTTLYDHELHLAKEQPACPAAPFISSFL